MNTSSDSTPVQLQGYLETAAKDAGVEIYYSLMRPAVASTN